MLKRLGEHRKRKGKMGLFNLLKVVQVTAELQPLAQAREYVPEKKMTRRENGSRADSISKRNRYVLPVRCIICHKDSA